MTTYPYVDIHCHRPGDSDVLSIHNLNYQDKFSNQGLYFSASLHPWHLPSHINQWSEIQAHLAKLISNPQCIALGEIGLDRKSETSWDLQMSYFNKAVHWAVDNHISIIILHSVKAHQECIHTLKEANYKNSVIFHDFHGSWQETESLLSLDKVYLSLGAVLDRPQAKLYQHLAKLPLERLFLETDDHQTTIDQRYQQFCALTSHDPLAVTRQLHYNFKKIMRETHFENA